MFMAEKIPKVLLLKPFRPDQAQVDATELHYPHLAEAVDKHVPHSSERWARYLAESDPVQEEALARQLASQYLLQTAMKATTVTPDESRSLWADRFTQASSELHGTPDETVARELFNEQLASIFSSPESDDVAYPAFLVDVIEGAATGEVQTASLEEMYGNVAQELAEYLQSEYADIMELFDTLPDTPLYPQDIARIFSNVKAALEQRDSDWADWEIALIDNDKLSAGSGKINVGLNRRPASPSELKGLCGHEILVHALRSVNGKKHAPELGSGLPGYLDIEEGLGVFVEYALTGQVPDKIIDRYIDIAAARGDIFDHPLNRQEMYELVLARNTVRARQAGTDVDESSLRAKTWEHVNRIYRGSRGDEYVGVFAKDIVYFEGFRLVGDYIAQALANGQSIGDVMNYLLQGKFDPSNEAHVAFLEAHTTIQKVRQ